MNGFKLAKPFLLVFLAAANSGGLAQLFSVPDQHLGSHQPSSPAAPGPTGSGTHPPRGYGCMRGAFRGGAYSPWCLKCGLSSL